MQTSALPQHRTLAEAIPHIVWTTDPSGGATYFSQRWYSYTGQSAAISLGRGFLEALHPDDREHTQRIWERARGRNEAYEIEYRLRRHDNSYRWFLARAEPLFDDAGELREWVGTCTDIDEQKRGREALAFLAEASALLSSSLDYEETLASLARLAVPHIADWCAIDLCEPGGAIKRLAAAHVDPSKVALAEELHRRFPHDPAAPAGVPAVIRTGQPEIVPIITEEMVRSGIEDPELLQIFLDLGLRSSMVVPLSVRGQPLGALTLVAAESGRFFGEADLSLAQDLAGRAAVAIEHAKLYRDLRQFRETLDRTADCVFMCDAESLRFFYVNQGAVEQVGYSTDELLGMTPLDLKPAFDEASYRAMIAPLRAGDRSLYSFETLHRHKDGHDVEVEVTLQYVDPPEGDPRLVAIVRDISERKAVEAALRASERRYRALADAMPLLVWIADPAGELIDANQPWVAYTGANPRALGPQGWATLVHPDDLAPTAERWNEALASLSTFEVEQRLRSADGSFSWYLVRAHPVRDANGRIEYWVGTNTDIDEQKRAEAGARERAEALAMATRLLEDRNRELDQFAYVTSHDLKAPLRGIANLAQWIEEDLGDHATAEIRGQLELLRGRAHRMEALIDGILQYSRVGRASATPEPVAVAELLGEVIDLLAPPVDATISIGPAMPTLVADRVQLSQVFANLIGNALKHHAGAGASISVTARNLGRHHEFAVSDNGPGIAPQYHERIFGIFQTLASRDRVEGSGLGLALVKKIVERQGGQVWVTSQEGQGATFFFTWPTS